MGDMQAWEITIFQRHLCCFRERYVSGIWGGSPPPLFSINRGISITIQNHSYICIFFPFLPRNYFHCNKSSLSALSFSLSNFIALDLEIGVGEASITVLYVNSAFSWLDMVSGLLWILTQLFLTLDNSLHYFLFFVVLFLLKGWERSKPTTPRCKDINKFPNEEWRFSSGGNSYNLHFFSCNFF